MYLLLLEGQNSLGEERIFNIALQIITKEVSPGEISILEQLLSIIHIMASYIKVIPIPKHNTIEHGIFHSHAKVKENLKG